MANIQSSASKQTSVENLIFDPAKMSFEDFFKHNAVMFFPQIKTSMMAMGGLRLDLLPDLAKQVLMRWLFEVNRRRLEGGLPLMVTYDIVKQCPLWKIIPMPYRTYKLNKEIVSKLGHMVPVQNRLNFKGIK